MGHIGHQPFTRIHTPSTRSSSPSASTSTSYPLSKKDKLLNRLRQQLKKNSQQHKISLTPGYQRSTISSSNKRGGRFDTKKAVIIDSLSKYICSADDSQKTMESLHNAGVQLPKHVKGGSDYNHNHNRGNSCDHDYLHECLKYLSTIKNDQEFVEFWEKLEKTLNAHRQIKLLPNYKKEDLKTINTIQLKLSGLRYYGGISEGIIKSFNDNRN